MIPKRGIAPELRKSLEDALVFVPKQQQQQLRSPDCRQFLHKIEEIVHSKVIMSNQPEVSHKTAIPNFTGRTEIKLARKFQERIEKNMARIQDMAPLNQSNELIKIAKELMSDNDMRSPFLSPDQSRSPYRQQYLNDPEAWDIWERLNRRAPFEKNDEGTFGFLLTKEDPTAKPEMIGNFGSNYGLSEVSKNLFSPNRYSGPEYSTTTPFRPSASTQGTGGSAGQEQPFPSAKGYPSVDPVKRLSMEPRIEDSKEALANLKRHSVSPRGLPNGNPKSIPDQPVLISRASNDPENQNRMSSKSPNKIDLNQLSPTRDNIQERTPTGKSKNPKSKQSNQINVADGQSAGKKLEDPAQGNTLQTQPNSEKQSNLPEAKKNKASLKDSSSPKGGLNGDISIPEQTEEQGQRIYRSKSTISKASNESEERDFKPDNAERFNEEGFIIQSQKPEETTLSQLGEQKVENSKQSAAPQKLRPQGKMADIQNLAKPATDFDRQHPSGDKVPAQLEDSIEDGQLPEEEGSKFNEKQPGEEAPKEDIKGKNPNKARATEKSRVPGKKGPKTQLAKLTDNGAHENEGQPLYQVEEAGEDQPKQLDDRVNESGSLSQPIPKSQGSGKKGPKAQLTKVNDNGAQDKNDQPLNQVRESGIDQSRQSGEKKGKRLNDGGSLNQAEPQSQASGKKGPKTQLPKLTDNGAHEKEDQPLHQLRETEEDQLEQPHQKNGERLNEGGSLNQPVPQSKKGKLSKSKPGKGTKNEISSGNEPNPSSKSLLPAEDERAQIRESTDPLADEVQTSPDTVKGQAAAKRHQPQPGKANIQKPKKTTPENPEEFKAMENEMKPSNDEKIDSDDNNTADEPSDRRFHAEKPAKEFTLGNSETNPKNKGSPKKNIKPQQQKASKPIGQVNIVPQKYEFAPFEQHHDPESNRQSNPTHSQHSPVKNQKDQSYSSNSSNEDVKAESIEDNGFQPNKAETKTPENLGEKRPSPKDSKKSKKSPQKQQPKETGVTIDPKNKSSIKEDLALKPKETFGNEPERIQDDLVYEHDEGQIQSFDPQVENPDGKSNKSEKQDPRTLQAENITMGQLAQKKPEKSKQSAATKNLHPNPKKANILNQPSQNSEEKADGHKPTSKKEFDSSSSSSESSNGQESKSFDEDEDLSDHEPSDTPEKQQQKKKQLDGEPAENISEKTEEPKQTLSPKKIDSQPKKGSKKKPTNETDLPHNTKARVDEDTIPRSQKSLPKEESRRDPYENNSENLSSGRPSQQGKDDVLSTKPSQRTEDQQFEPMEEFNIHPKKAVDMQPEQGVKNEEKSKQTAAPKNNRKQPNQGALKGQPKDPKEELETKKPKYLPENEEHDADPHMKNHSHESSNSDHERSRSEEGLRSSSRSHDRSSRKHHDSSENESHDEIDLEQDIFHAKNSGQSPTKHISTLEIDPETSPLKKMKSQSDKSVPENPQKSLKEILEQEPEGTDHPESQSIDEPQPAKQEEIKEKSAEPHKLKIVPPGTSKKGAKKPAQEGQNPKNTKPSKAETEGAKSKDKHQSNVYKLPDAGKSKQPKENHKQAHPTESGPDSADLSRRKASDASKASEPKGKKGSKGNVLPKDILLPGLDNNHPEEKPSQDGSNKTPQARDRKLGDPKMTGKESMEFGSPKLDNPKESVLSSLITPQKALGEKLSHLTSSEPTPFKEDDQNPKGKQNLKNVPKLYLPHNEESKTPKRDQGGKIFEQGKHPSTLEDAGKSDRSPVEDQGVKSFHISQGPNTLDSPQQTQESLFRVPTGTQETVPTEGDYNYVLTSEGNENIRDGSPLFGKRKENQGDPGVIKKFGLTYEPTSTIKKPKADPKQKNSIDKKEEWSRSYSKDENESSLHKSSSQESSRSRIKGHSKSSIPDNQKYHPHKKPNEFGVDKKDRSKNGKEPAQEKSKKPGATVFYLPHMATEGAETDPTRSMEESKTGLKERKDSKNPNNIDSKKSLDALKKDNQSPSKPKDVVGSANKAGTKNITLEPQGKDINLFEKDKKDISPSMSEPTNATEGKNTPHVQGHSRNESDELRQTQPENKKETENGKVGNSKPKFPRNAQIEALTHELQLGNKTPTLDTPKFVTVQNVKSDKSLDQPKDQSKSHLVPDKINESKDNKRSSGSATPRYGLAHSSSRRSHKGGDSNLDVSSSAERSKLHDSLGNLLKPQSKIEDEISSPEEQPQKTKEVEAKKGKRPTPVNGSRQNIQKNDSNEPSKLEKSGSKDSKLRLKPKSNKSLNPSISSAPVVDSKGELSSSKIQDDLQSRKDSVQKSKLHRDKSSDDAENDSRLSEGSSRRSYSTSKKSDQGPSSSDKSLTLKHKGSRKGGKKLLTDDENDQLAEGDHQGSIVEASEEEEHTGRRRKSRQIIKIIEHPKKIVEKDEDDDENFEDIKRFTNYLRKGYWDYNNSPLVYEMQKRQAERDAYKLEHQGKWDHYPLHEPCIPEESEEDEHESHGSPHKNYSPKMYLNVFGDMTVDPRVVTQVSPFNLYPETPAFEGAKGIKYDIIDTHQGPQSKHQPRKPSLISREAKKRDSAKTPESFDRPEYQLNAQGSPEKLSLKASSTIAVPKQKNSYIFAK